MEASLRAEYVAKSKQAFIEEDFKLCLVLLGNITVDEPELLITKLEAAYFLWLRTYKSKSLELENVVELAKETFSEVLGHSNHSVVRPNDYIALSHIYITEGSLEGALQIMQLASARGCLENLLIVLQSWTLLTRISSKKESNKNMMFLSSALTLETVTRKKLAKNKSLFASEIQYLDPFCHVPLYYVYLHAAMHQMRKLKYMNSASSANNTRKTLEFNSFASNLSDAYYLCCGMTATDIKFLTDWLRQDGMWYEMGVTLETDTPFVLLAEDSYWEAYLLAPLKNRAIEALITLMRVTHRHNKVPEQLAKAIKINPWNSYARNTLKEVELLYVVKESERQWHLQFQFEEKQLAKIQGVLRGILIRLHWSEISKSARENRKRFKYVMKISEEKNLEVLKRYHILIIHRWKAYIEAWKALKYYSATRIQSLWRKIWCKWNFSWDLWRSRRANAMYIICAQRNYDLTVTFHLRRWHAVYTLRKKHKSATLITECLKATSYSRLVQEAMNFMITALRIPRKHLYKRIFKKWKERYDVRQLVHAKYTIRFWIRDCYKRKAQREKEEQLRAMERAWKQKLLEAEQAAAAQAKEKNEVHYQAKYIALMKEKWLIWRAVYRSRVNERKLIKLTTTLRILHARKKAIRRVKDKRIRYEAQMAYLKQKFYKEVGSIFLPWKYTAFVYKIQRFIRCKLAIKKLKRLQNIQVNTKIMHRTWRTRILQHIFNRILKNNFLERREKIRASKWIVLLFRKILSRALLRRKQIQRIGLVKTLRLMHYRFTAFFFNILKRNTVNLDKSRKIMKYFEGVRFGPLREGINIWKAYVFEQQILQKLHTKLFINRVEHKYFKGVYYTVCMRSLKESKLLLSRDESHDTDDDHHHSHSSQSHEFLMVDTKKPLEKGFKPWEIYIKPSRRRWNIAMYVQLKAFKSWLISYRIRNRYRRGGSYVISRRIFNSYVAACAYRIRCAIRIQCFYRVRKALRIVLQLRRNSLRREELKLMLLRKRVLKVYQFMSAFYTKHLHSRIKIQNLVRQFNARTRVRRERANVERLKSNYELLNKSECQGSLMRKIIQKMLIMYCIMVLHPQMFPKTGTRGMKKRGADSSHGGKGGSYFRNNMDRHTSRAKLSQSLTRLPSNNYANSKHSPQQHNHYKQQKRGYLTSKYDDDSSGIVYGGTVGGKDDGESSSNSSEEGSEGGGDDSDNFDEDGNELDEKHKQLNKYLKSLKNKNTLQGHATNTASLAATAANKGKNKTGGAAAASAIQLRRITKTKSTEMILQPIKKNLYQSEKFHSLVFMLKRTSSFVYEVADRSLQMEELDYFLESADTLFMQGVNKKSLQKVVTKFKGNKIVICNGFMSKRSYIDLLSNLAYAAMNGGGRNNNDVTGFTGAGGGSSVGGSLNQFSSGNVAADLAFTNAFGNTVAATATAGLKSRNILTQKPILSLHITNTPFTLEIVKYLCSYLRNDGGGGGGGGASSTGPTASSMQSSVTGGGRSTAAGLYHALPLAEFGIDIESTGTLGWALLLSSMETNISIQSLVLKCSHHKWIRAFDVAFEKLCINQYIKELRIHDVDLDVPALKILANAVKDGFPRLSSLEFMVSAVKLQGKHETKESKDKKALLFMEKCVYEMENIEELADFIIQQAKTRTLLGKNGLSVMINRNEG